MLDHPYDEYLKGLVRARELAEHGRPHVDEA
jgi:hypothetical protein